ncbi:LytR/AlgR family response regulator transcription factor [Lachnoclostridium sp. An181]|uniref:LytR/AlgR family response regulator transcription factor n=1 Tax=Lachnoclostridium sp. An181 TaxID=1965575 RepID=UPI000B3A267A|nr:hypothetical protein B5F18_10520 [Lachnoclostridium sp. An181]
MTSSFVWKTSRICVSNFNQSFAFSLLFTLSSFSDGVSFLESFQTERYSIVFMDIYMNGLNGLETAAKVRKVDGKCILIFLTSSKEFMPKAFSFHSFEYVIKPFSYKRFECDVKNVRKHSLNRISFPLSSHLLHTLL